MKPTQAAKEALVKIVRHKGPNPGDMCVSGLTAMQYPAEWALVQKSFPTRPGPVNQDVYYVTMPLEYL